MLDSSFRVNPEDIVIFRVPERSSAGYLWDESRLRDDGFDVLADDREEKDSQCGSAVTRVIVTRIGESRECRVSLSERRPWHLDDSVATLTIDLDMRGKEDGLPRFVRKRITAA